MRMLLSVLFLSLLTAWGGESLPHIEASPTLDGRLDDPCWSGLPWNGKFSRLGSDGADANIAQTRFKSFQNGDFIYFAVEADEPDMERLVTEKYQSGSTSIWQNDSIEISLCPGNNVLRCYRYIMDSTGALATYRAEDDNRAHDQYIAFDWTGSAEVKTSKGNGKWLLEAKIPIGTMEIDASAPPIWRVNVGRNRYAGTKAELSSWSAIPVMTHIYPKAFKEIQIENFMPKRFAFAIEGIKHDFKQNPDKAFEYKVQANIVNSTGRFAIVNSKVTLTNMKTMQVYAAEKILPLRTSYMESSLGISDIPPGEYLLEYTLASNSKTNPVPLKKVSMQTVLEYKLLRITLKRPAYRNNIYATMPDKTIEAELSLTDKIGMPIDVELTGDGYKKNIRIEKSTGKDKATFDGSELQDGTYILRAACGDAKDELRIRKLPYRKGEVWLDKDGVTHVDGEKILPFGWAYTAESQPYLNWAVLNNFLDVPRTRAWLNHYTAMNIRLLLFPYPSDPTRAFYTAKNRAGRLTAEQRKLVTEYITQIAPEDGILAWYMADEPEDGVQNPLWYEDLYELVSELDPYHPCIMLNWGPDGMKQFYRSCDILMPDCYPQYFEDRSTSHPRWCSSIWSQFATSLRPSWLMPLMTTWPSLSRDGKNKRGLPPDYQEQRAQFLQAAIHNIKGFGMYLHTTKSYSSAIFIGVDDIGATLQQLKEYIFENTVPDGVIFKTHPDKPHFQAGLKKYNGQTCLIAVNTSGETVKADFNIKDAALRELAVAGENRSVALNGGKFSDSFAPYESHVYLSDGKLARVVPNVAETEKRIAAHRAARKKSGNLVAVGEMILADLHQYSRGDVPAGIVRIKASSDNVFPSAGADSTLYFLVDGITDPGVCEPMWAPLENDKSPWLEFELPKAAPAKEVRLYTPHANIIDCSITDDTGKSYKVSGNSSEVLSIPLGGTVTKKIRIDILKTKKLNFYTRKTQDRLLSEVEIY